MDALFLPLAAATGASLDQLKLIACLLISYPLGSVFIRIPNDKPNLKHLFNVFVAVVYLIPVLSLWTGFLQLLADVLATYVIARNVKSSKMPWIVFALTMGHLMTNHVIRAVFNFSYETVEITGPQMVLVMKLTTFAWNVYDGRKPVEELDKWQTEKRVVEYPSLLSFLGYSFYFPGVLVGPYLEFADYMNMIDGSLYKNIDKEVDEKRKAARIPGRLVPRGRKRVAYRKMVVGLAYLGAFVVLGGQYNYPVALQESFVKRSLWYRIMIYQACGFFERTKYYAIWTLTEGAAILTGLGFTGFSASGATLWEGAANVKVLAIEMPSNVKTELDAWNMKTNVWLRECVYKRVTPKGKKPGFRSSMITFMTSAFWHGIAVGYYLTFVLGGFTQTVGRLCRSYIRPLFLQPTYVAARGAPPPPQTTLKTVYDVLGTLSTVLMINYIAGPFMLLTWQDSITVWTHLGWYGHWMIFGALAFFYAGGTVLLKQTQAKRLKKAGVKVEREGAKANGKTNGKANGTANGTAKSGTVTPGVQAVPPFDDVAREVEKSEFMRKINH